MGVARVRQCWIIALTGRTAGKQADERPDERSGGRAGACCACAGFHGTGTAAVSYVGLLPPPSPHPESRASTKVMPHATNIVTENASCGNERAVTRYSERAGGGSLTEQSAWKASRSWLPAFTPT